MKLAGYRRDGTLRVLIPGGVTVVLKGDLASPPLDDTEADQLGPWIEPDTVLSAQERQELGKRLDRSRVVSVQGLVLRVGEYSIPNGSLSSGLLARLSEIRAIDDNEDELLLTDPERSAGAKAAWETRKKGGWKPKEKAAIVKALVQKTMQSASGAVAQAPQAAQAKAASVAPGPAPTAKAPPDPRAILVATLPDGRPRPNTFAKTNGISADRSTVNVTDKNNQTHVYRRTPQGWAHHSGVAADPTLGAYFNKMAGVPAK